MTEAEDVREIISLKLEIERLRAVIRDAAREFDLIAGRYAERDQNLGVDQLNKIWNDLGNEVDSWGGEP